MIRIRHIHDAVLEANRNRVAQVQDIFRANFPDVADYAEKIPRLLSRPFHYGYRTILLVAEGINGKVTGFSLFFYLPEINSGLLDYVAVAGKLRSGGIGGALYEATREYLSGMQARGLYMEVLPDDPQLIRDPQVLEANRRRLRFYERYGARPIIGTAYETPIDDSPAPHLLFDGLGRTEPLSRAEAQAAVRLILERKYSHLVNDRYIDTVVNSFQDDPVRFRPPRQRANGVAPHPVSGGRLAPEFAVVLTTGHEIHHVKDRGYVERPARVNRLFSAVMAGGQFQQVEQRHHGDTFLKSVHDVDFINYLRAACSGMAGNGPVYPYVFPVRRPERKPKELALRAGYYCIDTFTPLDRNAYNAARAAADTALTAAELVSNGQAAAAYALCRPPGHHAGKRTYGGFCYFNNNAMAAQLLAGSGNKVAILDIDFHHGNGQQEIFYERADVLTVSLHGHPNFAYPYFSGFADETGQGHGRGFNLNLPLPDGANEELYLEALEKAIYRIQRFSPRFLVVALGFDTMKGDPTGGFALTHRSLRKIGARIGALQLPAVVVQEGGYNLTNLQNGATAFFKGLYETLIIGPP